MTRPELLAPAGDLDRLKTAVDFGADAVYAGGRQLSLRSRADNLSLADIAAGAEYAARHGAKLYITVNMMPHDDDLGEVTDYLRALQDCGVSAVIVSSLNIIRWARRCAPKLAIHVSTQQTTLNAEAVRFWKEQGADRVILARELTLAEIRELQARQITELEVFIHGGMCANYSGRCLLSNLMTGRDANRGGCAQSCRWVYVDEQDGRRFTLGSKDLDARGQIESLMAIGIRSLKIEGRMKSAYYLACILKAYRWLIDRCLSEGALSEADLAYGRRLMGKAQNRETFPGFYPGIPGPEGLTGSLGIDQIAQDYIGEVVEARGGWIALRMRNHLELGWPLELIGPGHDPEPFTVAAMTDERQAPIAVANRPLQILWIKAAVPAAKGDFARRAAK